MSLSRKLAATLLSVACSVPVTAWSVDDEAVTPQRAAVLARVAALEVDYANSPDLALRILHSTNVLQERADGTFVVLERVPVATLVDLARGSTDPLVLDLLASRCGMPGDDCDRLDIARRWVQADAENQVAWLVLAAAQRRAGDVDGARATFLRASQASTWHDHYDDAIRRGVRALPADLSASERLEALNGQFARAGLVIAFGAIQVVGNACKEDGPMRTACARIVETMVRDGNLMALNVAIPYAARAGLSRTTIAAYQQKADAIREAMGRSASPSDATGSDDPATMRQSLAALAARVTLGERESAERYLVDHHLSEADAAKAQVARLSPQQIERRTTMLEARDLREATLRAKG